MTLTYRAVRAGELAHQHRATPRARPTRSRRLQPPEQPGRQQQAVAGLERRRDSEAERVRGVGHACRAGRQRPVAGWDQTQRPAGTERADDGEPRLQPDVLQAGSGA